jgi:SAM-dependent methyltransferase
MSSEFHDFEQSGWESVANQYDESFGRLTTQVIPFLLDAAKVREGTHVLDVCSGPGYVAAAAVNRGAQVVAVDFSANMVRSAMAKYPGIDFRQGDAQDLPLEKDQFDAVVNNFGVLHLAHPEKALAEAYRVLRQGGRLAFTVWAVPEEAIAFGIVLEAVRSCGNVDVPLPPGPPFFRFSKPDEATAVLSGIGFHSISVQKVVQTWELLHAETLWQSMEEATVRTAGLLRAQTSEARDRIRKQIVEEAEKYREGDSIRLPMPAILISGVRM